MTTTGGSAPGRTPSRQLDVFFTVDVEIWCDGWNDIDAKFPDAFKRYVYGPTVQGHYGLPFQLDLLCAHGLTGTFFVEPLFATRFGHDALTEIVSLILAAGQEVQLHLHTEWVDEARMPLLPDVTGKRQFLSQFTLAEQTELLRVGSDLLTRAGAPHPRAFRAGSFAANRDTVAAVRANGMVCDSSYNATMFGPACGISQTGVLYDATTVDASILELPMTVFKAPGCAPRHVQLGACSFAEMESLMWEALDAGQRAFVILSHNFELLNPRKDRIDPVVVNRFHRLCSFLERNADAFRVRGMSDADKIASTAGTAQPLRSSVWKAGWRQVEQLYRRRYQ